MIRSLEQYPPTGAPSEPSRAPTTLTDTRLKLLVLYALGTVMVGLLEWHVAIALGSLSPAICFIAYYTQTPPVEADEAIETLLTTANPPQPPVNPQNEPARPQLQTFTKWIELGTYIALSIDRELYLIYGGRETDHEPSLLEIPPEKTYVLEFGKDTPENRSRLISWIQNRLSPLSLEMFHETLYPRSTVDGVTFLDAV